MDPKVLVERFSSRLIFKGHREPRHGSKVFLEPRLVLVAGHEYHLERLRRVTQHLIVRLDELRGELAARAAPVRGEVNPDVCARGFERTQRNFGAVGSDELVADGLREGRWFPRERLRVLHHGRASVFVEDVALLVQDDEGRDAADLVLGAELVFEIALGELHGEPRLFAVVLGERGLVLVRGGEDDLEVLTLGLELLVNLTEDRGELAARGAPGDGKGGQGGGIDQRSEQGAERCRPGSGVTPCARASDSRGGGGETHQCAEKYTPTILSLRASSVFTSVPPSATSASPKSAGAQEAMRDRWEKKAG